LREEKVEGDGVLYETSIDGVANYTTYAPPFLYSKRFV